jgi:hypothetical protein
MLRLGQTHERLPVLPATSTAETAMAAIPANTIDDGSPGATESARNDRVIIMTSRSFR